MQSTWYAVWTDVLGQRWPLLGSAMWNHGRLFPTLGSPLQNHGLYRPNDNERGMRPDGRNMRAPESIPSGYSEHRYGTADMLTLVTHQL